MAHQDLKEIEHDYYRGEEAQYEHNHLQWEVNRIADRANYGHLLRNVREHVGRPKRCLDIACGSGRTMEQLLGEVDHVVGLDLSLGLIRIAYDKIGPQSYVLADAQCLPFRDGTFDLVTINGALHHIPDPYLSTMEAGRVLEPNGLLAILGEPNSRYMRWKNPFFAMAMGWQAIRRPSRFRKILELRRKHGVENVNLEVDAHNINPQKMRWACEQVGVEAREYTTYDYLPRAYSHARLVRWWYRGMVKFEEAVLARILPLNGTVLRYFGVKRKSG